MKTASQYVSEMTLSEKVSLLSGQGFWWIPAVERLGLPEVMMCDGPHGLRKQGKHEGNEVIDKSNVAVCYPTASLSACSFNRDTLLKEGKAIGHEAKAEKVSIVLGPGVNMKRSPLCGRNFEYFSEDPFLAGEMGAMWVRGVRSTGAFCSLKHFCSNNQERFRMVGNAVIDERTLREIYLSAFERVVKEKPGTVMCCYNKVNDEFGSENKHTLTEVLRDDWGFDGVTVTDWGAINDRVLALQNGMDLEMPSSNGERNALLQMAVEKGELDEKIVDRSVERIVSLMLTAIENLEDTTVDFDRHHEIAREIAEDSMLLLKNDHFFPIKKDEKVLYIGEFMKNHRFQGAGSSMINAYKKDNILDCLSALGFDTPYEQGYLLDKMQPQEELIARAKEEAKKYDKIVIACGLTNAYESEGYDRTDLKMPIAHTKLLDEILSVNQNVGIVLLGGSPVEMDFADNVKGVLNAYLGGEGAGAAVANLISGKVNPSGRLAETIPYKLADVPSVKNYPGNILNTEYREGLFIGYRYYDTADVPVRFPFGFGLSYTKFEYLNATLEGNTVNVTIKNVGDVAGKEVVQVYVGKNDSKIFRAKKELKGFAKVELQPDEEKTVQIELDERAFSYFNTELNRFAVEEGTYQIYVAKNVSDVKFTLTTTMASADPIPQYDKDALRKYYFVKDVQNVSREEFETLLGRKVIERRVRPFTISSSVEELQPTFVGKILKKVAIKQSLEAGGTTNEAVIKMITAGAMEMPLKAMPAMTGGAFNLEQCQGIADMCNGKFFKGLKKFTKGKKLEIKK